MTGLRGRAARGGRIVGTLLCAAWCLLQMESLAAAGSTAAAVSAGDFKLRWVSDSTDPKKAFAEVTGLNSSALKQLRRSNWKTEQWQRLLVVRAEQGDLLADIGLPPMLGEYRVTADALRFEPQFPLEAGLAYRATFQPGQLPGARNKRVPLLSAVFQRRVQRTSPTTVVTQIYPSGGTVPENLLKFYVHFSAPMRGGHIYEHIHLLDDAGKPVELPFLEIDEELWNPEMTRLTLFIDPGRIKREVKPLEEIGPALEEGKHYTLVIDQEWKDNAGIPLKETFRRAFRVGPPDRDAPDPARWKIHPPKPGTREPLAIGFPKPMDHALARRMIQVELISSGSVQGQIVLDEEERRWTFVPAEAWRAGSYKLAVQTTIEDLAGNNIGKPFEVDVFDGVQRRLTNSTVTLQFEVR